MPLAPPAEGESHPTLEQLIWSVNHHAGPEGYAVVTARTKNSKLGVKRKAWLRCDRGGKSSGPRGQIRIHGASRRINCPFSIIAKRQDDAWTFRVVNGGHSHDPTPPETHPALRKMALAEKSQNGSSSQSTGPEMIQSREIQATSGLADENLSIDSGNHVGKELELDDPSDHKTVDLHSIENDLMGHLETLLDPRMQNELSSIHVKVGDKDRGSEKGWSHIDQDLAG
jgi:hypothetical protein